MNIAAWLVVGAPVGWAARLVWHDLEGLVLNADMAWRGCVPAARSWP